MSATSPKPGYVESAIGLLHYVEQGTGRPVILLHQTPRSSDEFRELLPLLAQGFRAIALDMPGFGLSVQLPTPQTIEDFAQGVIAFLDVMDIDTAVVLGHHTGAVVALEIAASNPDRVEALILSSMAYVDAPARERRAAAPKVDDAVENEDGSHLTQLWSGRAPLYPAGRPDILNRFVRDALAPGVDPTEGHRAVGRYTMEERIGLVSAPTLLIGATDDPASFPDLPTVRQQLTCPNQTILVHGGMIPLMEMHSHQVSQAVGDFLASLPAR